MAIADRERDRFDALVEEAEDCEVGGGNQLANAMIEATARIRLAFCHSSLAGG